MGRKPKRNFCFFKVLTGDFLNKLRIPPVFAKNFLTTKLRRNFTLKTDAGSSWNITVKRKKYGFYFCNGWSTFAKHHRLEFGDFLLFFLLNCSTFEVIVCDRTCCSKDLRFAAKRPRDRPISNKQIEESGSKSSASCSKTAKSFSPARNSSVKRAQKFSQVTKVLPEVSPNQCSSFQRVLKRQYQRSYITVPKSFAEDLGLAQKEFIAIKGPKGRDWRVNITLDRGLVRLGGGWSKFVQENEIEVGDALTVKRIPNGNDSIQVQVTRQAGDKKNVGRSNKRPNPCEINTGSAAKGPRGLPVVNRQIQEIPSTSCANAGPKWARKGNQNEYVSEVISDHSSFELVFKKYHKSYIVFPKDFVVETGLSKETKIVIKDPNGRIWPVKIRVNSIRTTVGAGWFKFLQANNIVVGKTLVFKHIRNKGKSFCVQVTIRARDGNCGRQNKQPNASQMNISTAAKRRRVRPKLNKQTEEIPSIRCLGANPKRVRNGSDDELVEFISETKSKHPSFRVELKAYQSYSVAVPSSFVEESGLAKEESTTTIEDPEGRRWKLNISVDSKSNVRLCGGWPNFLKGNGLVVGDILLFEHIPNTGNLIHFQKGRR